MAPHVSWTLSILLLGSVVFPGGLAFFPNFWTKFLGLTWKSYTHQDLTEDAILNVTLQILLDHKHPTRPPINVREFQGKTLIADDILRAYFGEEASARQFRASMQQIVNANANMDFFSGTRDDPLCHFDSERLLSGNSRLLRSREKLLEAVIAKDYEGARQKLGQILHSLQDFYSHTNWVEMGNKDINTDLASPGKQVNSLARASDQTCTDCSDSLCQNNIADFINKNKLLTSGYYGETPNKPQGKCSHGGPFDDSRHRSALGGINKDTASFIYSPHHFLHHKAAKLALEASINFLSELKIDITDKEMLRLLGVSSFPALSFVVDTTGSMGEEITAVRRQAHNIIYRQNMLPPDHFILVPFHDPGFGPLLETSNPREFLDHLDSLIALGGGDEPEMCLSALQLALIHTPPYSEIFVFTDASSKDMELRSSVEALIQERKIKVSFLITEDPDRMQGRRRKRRELLRQDRFNLYSELAFTSGGQIIFSNNEDIDAVTDIIKESSHFDIVNLLDVKSEKRGEATHVFEIDHFIRNVTLFINGDIRGINVYNPDGHIQIVKNHREGLFTRITLEDPLMVGNWSVAVKNTNPYTLHVQGRSSFDFLYYFGSFLNGSHPGLYKYTNQPVAGVPSVLVVEAIGLPEAAHLDQVSLTFTQGETHMLPLEPTNQSRLLIAEVGHLPIGEFRVGVTGQDGTGHVLHREAPQHGKAAECVMEISTVLEHGLAEGERHLMSLMVTKYGSSNCYAIKLSTDNKDFKVWTDVNRVEFGDTNSVNASEFWIEAPTTMNTDSMLTVTATAASCHDKTKSCFTMQRLPVKKKPEAIPLIFPNCTILSYSGICPLSELPNPCKQHPWSVTFLGLHSDGIESVRVLHGAGSVLHETDGIYEHIHFTSDCCSKEVELLLISYTKTSGYCHARALSASALPSQDKLMMFLVGIIFIWINSW
ncbi:von Willebrand factor A domain-containing protein 7 [Pelobates fuscus]|uniref:von Willebrand factor A domain-containing protein 7 n=1 Tax=Pelobates fuscus TaxID=191477 RepID=UPI002FE4E7F7